MAQVDVLLGMKISQEGLLSRETSCKNYWSSQRAKFFPDSEANPFRMSNAMRI